MLSWNSALLGYEEWRLDVIRDFLANAWDIAFLLDSDHAVTAQAQSMGVLTLTLGHPCTIQVGSPTTTSSGLGTRWRVLVEARP